MKTSFAAGIRYALLALATTLGILLVVGTLLVFDWPWWVGIFLLLLLASLVLAGTFLRRWWLRRQARHCPPGAGAEQTAPAGAGSPGEPPDLHALQERWKAAIGTLCGSNLHKHGNPLYVLPWFLVIGSEGSGKSGALAGAGVPAPLPVPSAASPTPQCEWWFFEHAVFIDTAGRYTAAPDGSADRGEWGKLLSLLVKYRHKEPLNGLVVTLAADRLLGASEERLAADGRNLRQRIDELMRGVGSKVPVYLLVTKGDLVPGFREFCATLPPKTLDQGMGAVNQELSSSAAEFVENALQKVQERVRALCLQLLLQPRQDEDRPELLAFPEHLNQLNQSLATLLRHTFGDNPYQETPVLRGIFFGSSEPTAAAAPQGQAAPDGRRGCFLHDLFGRILPHDRLQLAPTRQSIHWRTCTGHLGLTCWVLLGTALCGLLSFSFVKNLSTIRAISHGFVAQDAGRRDRTAGFAGLEQFRRDILKVERHNGNWWIPRFGLYESVRLERGLKEKFCRQFHSTILEGLDRQLSSALIAVSPSTPDDLYGQQAVHLARRINLLNERLEGAAEGLTAKPRPAYLAASASAGGAPEDGSSFGDLYLCSLLWRSDEAALRKERDQLRVWLKQHLAAKGELTWMVAWVDRQSGLPPVTLRDFWGGSLTPAGEQSVPPAFTRKGREALSSLMSELRSAVGDQASLAAPAARFLAWHRSASPAAWHAFAADFAKGEQRLGSPAEWQQVAGRMASEQGPYFALLSRMAVELQPATGEAPPPAWLQQVYQFEAARAQAQVRQPEVIDRAAQGSKKILSTIRKNVGQEAGAQKLQAQLDTTKACRDYCCALRSLAPATASRSQVFQLASRTFAEDPATGTSPCYLAATAASRLRSGFGGASADPAVSGLIDGPWQFLWSYLRRESGAQLQALWEEQVLGGTLGMTGEQAMPVLLGPEGLAWRFVRGPAAPFLNRGISGYGAKEVLQGRIAFEPALYSFMNKGAKAQATVMAAGRPRSYSVGIKGLPTDTNQEAKVKPHATRLELQCGGNSQNLVNNNYPVAKTFAWSPEACGDAILQIEVGDQVLARHYPGPQGFPDFLKDFGGGRRTFAAREFPGEKSALDRLGVKSITVNYQFIGSSPIVQQAAALSGQAPRRIAKGWER